MKFLEKYSLKVFNKNIVKDLPLMPHLPSVVKYNTTYGDITEFNKVCDTFLIDYHQKEIIHHTRLSRLCYSKNYIEKLSMSNSSIYYFCLVRTRYDVENVLIHSK